MPEPSIERRALLGIGAILLAPSWLRAQDAARPSQSDRERKPLNAAWLDARRKGRPLFVIVAPRDAAKRAKAQAIWEYALVHGPDELLADLAQCEIAVGSLRDLGLQLPHTIKLPKKVEPLAFLIEADTRVVTAIDPVWTEFSADVLAPQGDEPARVRELKLRAHDVHAAVCKATSRDAEMLAARRVLEERAIGNPDRARVDVSPGLAPAHARVWAEAAGGGRKFAIHAIAEASRKHLRLGSPPSGPPQPGPIGGCGGVPCGTGHIPAASKRFLYFLTQS